MAYKALYRSYRPSKFSEVVGQKHVIQTLKNAIKEKKTSHAYVFSGLRGIGKTTIARILAKAVNCKNSVDGEPCNACANCLAIMNNETTDIIELDAATNNGVDEIRNILDRVNFLPSSLDKKVYIIDEVHMLTTQAFNALLKTLEEPPAYVMFILCTTEPHKIPLTILSRCQRFDFKQLTIEELIFELKKISEKEHIQISDEALLAIAESAEGGMRDALSILDQANVYADGNINVEDVNSITGNISNQKLIELIKSFNDDDATKSICIVNELLNAGKEVSRLTLCIIQFCRDLLLYKSLNDAKNYKHLANTQEFQQLALATDSQRLFYYIDVLVDVQNKIRFTNSQKIYLEVGIMKIVNSATDDINLLGRIENLENRLNGASDLTYGSSYISDHDVNQKLNVVESKIKKITNELEKNDLKGLEEKINSRLNVLEEETSKISVLPKSIEERLNVLENSINSQVTMKPTPQTNFENQDSSNTLYEEKINDINQQISNTTKKNDELFSSVFKDIENIKQTLSTIDLSNKESKTNEENDDIILELIEKVTTLEKEITNNKTLVDNSIVEEKPKVIEDHHLDEVVSELLEEFNILKTEINNIKEEQEHLNLEDKKPIIDQNIINEIEEFKKKLSEGVGLNNEECNLDLSQMEERLTKIENTINSSDNIELKNMIEEIKTNYFVLTKALQLLTEKLDKAKEGLVVEDNNSDSYNLIEKVNNLEEMVKYIKENYVECDKLETLEEKINSLKESLTSLKEENTQLRKENSIINDKNEEKELLDNEENSSLETSEEQKKITNEKEEETQVEVEQEENISDDTNQEEDLTSSVFDVHIVENILHEARSQECREEKIKLVANWPKIEDKVGGLLAPIARLLASGLLVANGNTHLLIVYSNAQLCNHIMEPKNYQDAKEILKVTFNKDYDFIALPDDTWKEKRLEYHNQYRVGNKFPVLTPINNPLLHVVKVNKEPALTERQKVLKKANDFFGFSEDEMEN